MPSRAGPKKRPTELHKRYGHAHLGFVDLTDPKHARLREQITNPGRTLSLEETEAFLKWLETGNGWH